MQETLTVQKDAISSFFDRASMRGYGKLPYFPVFGQRLVEVAQIHPGSSVLDVACGRGAILFPLAERVGAQGKAIGIDISKGMVEETNLDIQLRGLSNAIAIEMDSENLEFPDASFDTVLCGFALFFFPNLDRALSELLRVLKPSGTIAVATWGASDPAWNWFDEQRAAYGATLKLSTGALTTPEELSDELSEARFASVNAWVEETDWVCATELEWWDAMWSISLGAALEKLPPSVMDRFQKEAFRNLQSLRKPEGFHNRLQANFATGIKRL